MAIDVKTLLIAARDTLQQPKVGARALLQMGLPANVGWMALVLMAVVSAVVSALSFAMSAPGEDQALDQALMLLFRNPIQLAFYQGVALLIGIMLIYGVGRMFGGRGSLNQAVLLIAWLEFIMLLLQLAQFVILPISTPMAAAIGMFGFVLFLWLLTNFIAVLHGFESNVAVFMAIVGTILAVSFAAAILIVAFVGLGA